jgi:isopenicillin-N N-acyltransferase like protein
MSRAQAVVSLAGSPHRIGLRLGELCSQQLGLLVERRWKHLCETKGESFWRAFVNDSVSIARAEVAKSVEELEGVAEGAHVPLEKLYVLAGFTDFLDVAGLKSEGNCTTVLVRKQDGNVLIGQTWDMPTDMGQAAVVIDKTYEDGGRLVTMTTPVGLAHLGFNANGIAIGTNNLGERSPRPGIVFPLLINEALKAEDVQSAENVIGQHTRLSAHNYTLCHGREGMFIEACSDEMREIRMDHRNAHFMIHTNHYVSNDLMRHETLPSETSKERFAEATRLLRETREVCVESVKAVLCRRPTVCRYDPDGASTIGAVILDGASRTMHYALGMPPTLERWKKVTLPWGS